jgi:ribose transport system permease protein/AI-2 transport system permease protein
MTSRSTGRGAALPEQRPLVFKRLLIFFGYREFSLLIVIIICIFAFSRISPNFLTIRNFQSIIRNMPELLLVTAGMTLVLIGGCIDISAESILGIASIVIGKLLLENYSAVLAVLAGVAAAFILSSLNGFIVAYLQLPSIVVTLGALYLWRAVIFLLVAGKWLSGVPRVLDPIAKTMVGYVPLPFIVALFVVMLLEFFYKSTPFGCHLRAIGTNQYASQLCGLNVKNKIFFTYCIFGILLGIAAVFYVGKYRNVEMTVAQGMSLEALAAALIGGTSVSGGSGSFLGCILGVFFVLLLRNALILLHVPSIWDYAVLGGLILVSFGADRFIARYVES